MHEQRMAAALRRRLSATGKPQHVIAAATGTQQSTVSRFLAGVTNAITLPTYARLLAYCDAQEKRAARARAARR